MWRLLDLRVSQEGSPLAHWVVVSIWARNPVLIVGSGAGRVERSVMYSDMSEV